MDAHKQCYRKAGATRKARLAGKAETSLSDSYKR